jgi:hypothetical protein
MAQDPNFFTIKQVSDITKKHYRTIQKYIKQNRFPSAYKDKKSKKWYIPIYDLEMNGWPIYAQDHTTNYAQNHNKGVAEKDQKIIKLETELKCALEQIEILKDYNKTIKALIENKPARKHWWNFR